MKRILLVIFVVVACMAATGTAAADKPEREVIPVDDSFETDVCGFPVSANITGTIIRTTRILKDGGIRIHESYPTFRTRLTNVDTGETIKVGIPGPAIIEIAPDGSSTLTGSGPWAWFDAHPETGEPGIFITRGRFVAAFDADGNLISFSLVGTVKDMCAELAS
jgi:hypothetical protein